MAWHIARSINGSCSTACWCNHDEPEGMAIALSARDYQWTWKLHPADRPSRKEADKEGT